MHEFRVGFGFDVHRLVEGRPLILCGIKVPHEKGLLGHSDADVALHALIDALLGAAGLGDIGQHFPDTDEKYRGISSLKLLEETLVKVKKAGFSLGNVDLTIVAQRPRLSPHIPKMRTKLAEALGLPESAVNIKAKTTEGLGFCGREEGIAAYAVVLLYRG
jgi:2-C-methyl-D-erythritol 2,4-cyclodiphosphate synthase